MTYVPLMYRGGDVCVLQSREAGHPVQGRHPDDERLQAQQASAPPDVQRGADTQVREVSAARLSEATVIHRPTLLVFCKSALRAHI